MASSYTEILSAGLLITPSYNSFASFSFSSNLTLAWANQFQSTNLVVSNFMNFIPSTGGLTVTLPDATQNSNGTSFVVNNLSSHAFNLLGNDGSTIASIPGPSASIFYLASNATQAGTWFNIGAGGGFSAVTSISAATVNGNDTANLTISGVPITTSGTIDFTFIGDLGALINFNTSTGLAARTGTGTWALRELVGTSNQITISANADGVGGNPTIALASTITGITSLQAGNLQLSENTISAFTGGNIVLAPQAGGFTETSLPIAILNNTTLRFYTGATTGSGNYTSIQSPASITGGVNVALVLPTSPPVSAGQVLSTDLSGNLSWATVSAFTGSSATNSLPKFTNTSGTIGDTAIIVDAGNNITAGLASLTAGNINFNVTANTIASTSGNIILSPSGTNETYSTNNLSVRGGNFLKLFNSANSGFGGFSAVGTGASATNVWSLPATDAANANGIMISNASLNLSFSNMTLAYMPQAVVQFQGIASAGPVTLGYGQGVASVALTSTAGQYAVTFSNVFSNNDYVVMAVIQGATVFPFSYVPVNTSASVCNITFYTSNGSTTTASSLNGSLINIIFFGLRPTY